MTSDYFTNQRVTTGQKAINIFNTEAPIPDSINQNIQEDLDYYLDSDEEQ